METEKRVVKIQLPIMGNEALVYTRDRSLEFQMPVFENIKIAMGDKLKSYFEVEFIPDPAHEGGELMNIINEKPNLNW